MISRLLLFGATGDMVARLLLPALAELSHRGLLPDDLHIVGTARSEHTDDEWRADIATDLDQFGAHLPEDVRRNLVSRLHYVQSDVTNDARIAAAIDAASDGGAQPIVAYLALPQSLFDETIAAIGRAGLPDGSRIAIEKPFGENEVDARHLNDLLTSVVGDAGEEAIFRVDHLLGDSDTDSIVTWRMSNPAIEAIWNSTFIERIEILWDETLALEGRASFYDRAGALKDVMQNHMLQVLCAVCMRLPDDDHDEPARRLEMIRSIESIPEDQMATRTRRARYTAGRLGDRDIPAYVDEEGVDPAHMTETFAQVDLRIDDDRWRDVPVLMRAGKAAPDTNYCAVIHFRPAPGASKGSVLRVDVDSASGLTWSYPDLDGDGDNWIVMKSDGPPRLLSAYATVLLDLLSGGNARSVGREEAEASWRAFDPILRAWAEDRVPMEEYPAGTWLPSAR